MNTRSQAIILITIMLVLGTLAVLAMSVAGQPRPTSVGAYRTPGAQFPDGVWRVNVDIQPGVYRAVGSGGCYWQRLADLSGRFGAIIQVGGPYLPNTPLAVTIMPGDMAFHSAGCGLWVRAR